MGPKIKNRWMRIVIYIVIIGLMIGHLAFGAHNWMFRFMDLTIALMAGIRLWIEFHPNDN